MKENHTLKKQNTLDLLPSMGCVAVIIYMLYVLLADLVIAMIPNGSWLDGTKSFTTLFVLVIFHILSRYQIPEVIKKYDAVIYGFLYAMALVNCNLATLFLIAAFICYGIKKSTFNRCLSIFLAIAFVLEGLQIFFIYNGLDGNRINEILVENSWFVIWIFVGLYFFIKKPKFFTENQQDSKCISFMIYLFLTAFVLCFVGGILYRFFGKLSFLGQYLELSYSGHGIPELFPAAGRIRKILYLIGIFVLFGLHIFSFIKKKEKISLLFLIMTCYSVFFTDWSALWFSFCGFLCYMIPQCRNKQIKVAGIRYGEIWMPLLTGLVFLVLSFVITSGVDWGMNRKHTRIEISTEQLKECEGALVGYDVLPDGCLRSNRIDPWIVLNYGQFGLYDIQNVNVKVKYCERDYMYIFGIGQYNYDFRTIKNGDNYMDITFLTPDDMGLRIDLTESYDSYFLLDKIVFNDYSYIGNNLSKQLRLVTYFLWMLVFVRVLFLFFPGKSVAGETNGNR